MRRSVFRSKASNECYLHLGDILCDTVFILPQRHIRTAKLELFNNKPGKVKEYHSPI